VSYRTYAVFAQSVQTEPSYQKETQIIGENNTHIEYIQLDEDREVPDNLTVSFFGTTKWLEPTASNLYSKKRK
jgi:hypothetical protein